MGQVALFFDSVLNVRRKVMIQPIGETAGKVWRLLSENGKAGLSQLKRGVEVDPNLILQAIGWLAREDKLRIEKNGRYTTYSLKG
jgi:hypothetical protein